MNETDLESIPHQLSETGKGFLVFSLILAGVLFIISGFVSPNGSSGWGDKGLSPFFVIASISAAFQGFILYFAFKAAHLLSIQLNAIRKNASNPTKEK